MSTGTAECNVTCNPTACPTYLCHISIYTIRSLEGKTNTLQILVFVDISATNLNVMTWSVDPAQLCFRYIISAWIQHGGGYLLDLSISSTLTSPFILNNYLLLPSSWLEGH